MLGITAKDMDKQLNENDNHFVFSDGSDFDVSSFAWQWGDDGPSFNAGGEYKCAYLSGDGKMSNYLCDEIMGNALCYLEEKCEDASSESGRSSSVNFAIFALFTTGSFFDTFFVLIGPSFLAFAPP